MKFDLQYLAEVRLMENKIGVIKDIDSFGRVVIPKDFRERLLLDKSVEVVLGEDGILIRNPEYKLIKIDQEYESNLD